MVRKKRIARKKQKKRMAKEAKMILGGIGVIALLLTGIILVIAFDKEEVKEVEEIIEPEKHPNLFIDEVRFVNSNGNSRSDSDEHTVDATVYFTNNGEGTSKNVELEVFAMVSKSNMGEDSKSVHVGDVASMKTQKATFSLDLPKGNDYKIDLLVFEDGMITKKGFGTVKIEEASDVTAEQFKTTESKINWNSTEDDDDTYGGYGGGEDGEKACDRGAGSAVGIMVSVIIIILIFIIVISVVWSRRKKNINNNEGNEEDYELV